MSLASRQAGAAHLCAPPSALTTAASPKTSDQKEVTDAVGSALRKPAVPPGRRLGPEVAVKQKGESGATTRRGGSREGWESSRSVRRSAGGAEALQSRRICRGVRRPAEGESGDVGTLARAGRGPRVSAIELRVWLACEKTPQTRSVIASKPSKQVISRICKRGAMSSLTLPVAAVVFCDGGCGSSRSRQFWLPSLSSPRSSFTIP